MIYLIITASIYNKYDLSTIQHEERQTEYISAISQTLEYLPSEIIPIIVEGNGLRPTYLDNFIHNNQPIPVIYTENNYKQYSNKGIPEFLDIKEVIKRMNINYQDMIIKLTGRYRVTSSMFFNKIIQNEQTTKTDILIKLYNIHKMIYDPKDCILGLYGIRTICLLMFTIPIDLYMSIEKAFAKYITICGNTLETIDILGVECMLADEKRIAIV
jgi:hypothetical protein